MNSLKTTIVCVVLLGVLYGMYQVINTPSPVDESDETPIVDNFGTPVDPADLPALQNDPLFQMDEEPFQDLADDFDPPSGRGNSYSGQPGNPAPPSFADSNRDASPIPPSYASPLTDPDESYSTYGSEGETTAPDRLSPGSLASGSPNSDLRQPDPTYPDRSSPDLRMPNSTSSGSGYPDSLTSPGSLASRDGSLDGGPRNSEQETTRQLSETWESAEFLISKSRFQEALALLSSFHQDTELTPQEQENLQIWLDALAAKVIYSMEHHLTLPHQVQVGETIDQIANKYQVPSSLIYNINRDRIDANGWSTGIELKTINGPFAAEVNLTTQKLTLWLDNMYAGSFPVRIGRDQSLAEGIYRVAMKTDQGRVYTPANGSPIDRMTPGNPYGSHLIDLGRGVLIHGCPTGLDAHSGQGCISLDESHAQDIYEILSRSSEVRIVR